MDPRLFRRFDNVLMAAFSFTYSKSCQQHSLRQRLQTLKENLDDVEKQVRKFNEHRITYDFASSDEFDQKIEVIKESILRLRSQLCDFEPLLQKAQH